MVTATIPPHAGLHIEKIDQQIINCQCTNYESPIWLGKPSDENTVIYSPFPILLGNINRTRKIAVDEIKYNH